MTTPDLPTYASLQNEHQELLRQAEAGGDALTVEEVQHYIERIKAGAENVSDLRDRNQLRAVLRYWAAWVFERTNVYPDTTLRPALDEKTVQTVAAIDHSEVEGVSLIERVKSLILTLTRPSSLGGILLILSVIAILAAAFFLTFSLTGQPAAIGWTSTPSMEPVAPEETEAATQTQAAVNPPVKTSTPTASATPTDTPEAVITNTLQPSPTSTATSTPEVIIITTTPLPDIPSPTPRPTEPVNVDSPERDIFEVLIGSDPRKPSDCSTRSITLQNANPKLFADLNTVPSTVRVSRVGDDQTLFEGELPLSSPDEIEIRLDDPDLSQAYLVQIDHPLFPYPALIVQFGDDCQKNHIRVELHYPGDVPGPKDLPNRITQAEDPAAEPLIVEWFLTAWGPVPSHPGTWSAEVLVTAGNNDERAIFWDLSGPEPRQLPDRRLVLVTENCQSAFRRIGVSSGGQSAQTEIILRPASCPVR